MNYLHIKQPDCSKFIMFHLDGSGCDMFRVVEGKVFEADGEFYGKQLEDNHWSEAGYSAWMPIPDDFIFHGEEPET